MSGPVRGSLAAAGERVVEATRGPRCGVDVLIESLDADDRATLAGWVSDGREWSWIAAVLRSEGHRMAGQTLSRHYRGLCSCGTR